MEDDGGEESLWAVKGVDNLNHSEDNVIIEENGKKSPIRSLFLVKK